MNTLIRLCPSKQRLLAPCVLPLSPPQILGKYVLTSFTRAPNTDNSEASVRPWASLVSASGPSLPQETSRQPRRHSPKGRRVNPQPTGDVSQGINAPGSHPSDEQFREASRPPLRGVHGATCPVSASLPAPPHPSHLRSRCPRSLPKYTACAQALSPVSALEELKLIPPMS